MQLSGRKYHSRILYPAGGLNNLFRKAKENLDRLGVNIILNDKVTTLRYLTDPREGYQYESKTKAGNSYLSKSITSSSILSLEAIYINDKFIKPYYFINQSDHFTFLTQSSTNGNYGFAKVIDDEYFELVSDVSPFTPGLMDKHPGCKIVTCRF